MASATQRNKDLFMGGLRELLKEQWQADVLLKGGDSDVKDTAISAHKLILAGRSKVFKKLLESDEFKASSKVETITLSEMKHEEVEALVDFIYSSQGSIPPESLKKHARSLYVAADKYEIPYLRDLCRDHLMSSLNASNALSILELAQIPFDKALNDAAFNSIKANMIAIARSAEFKSFVVNRPNLSLEIVKASLIRPNNSYCRHCGYYN